MEGVDLGGAVLRLYGDRSALDRELETLRRYTEALERKGIKVRFDADTGKAVQEVDKLQNRLDGVNKVLQDLAKATHGDWSGLIGGLQGAGESGAAAAAGVGKAGGAVGGLMAAAGKAIPILGQLYLAGQGLKMIFGGVSHAIMGAIHAIEGLSHEAGRFNQQVATGSIFTAQAFSILGPDGKAIEGTANQMRALRGVMVNEYQRIHEEVSKINGATSAQVMESFNIILQHSQALGPAADELSNITDMAVAATAAMNVLGVSPHRNQSEITSLLLGDIQIYNTLARDLGYDREKVQRLQDEGRYFEEVMKDLNTLVDGQAVLSESLENVKSNYRDTFEVIQSQGYQALERGLAGSLLSVWRQFDGLRGSFMEFADGFSAFLEPIIRLLGQAGAALVPIIAAGAAITGAVMQGLGAVMNLLNAVLAGPLEALAGLLGSIATLIQGMVQRTARGLRAISAVFAVFASGEASQVRDFFESVNEGIKESLKWLDQWVDLMVKALRAFTEWNARSQARRALIADEKTGRLRRLTREEEDKRVQQAVDDFDRRTNFNPDVDLVNTNASRRYQQMSDELRDRYRENPELTIAQEAADVKQRSMENEIRGLQNGLRLLEAQRSVVQAMAELAGGRRQLAMAEAGFAVQLASSPETRLGMERQQRDLAAQQGREELQERRELLGQERVIQDRQAQIQDRQAQIQVVQLEIANMEAQIQADRAQQNLAEATRLSQIASGHKRDEYLGDRDRWQKEVQLRNQILEQTQRALALGQEAREVSAQAAATEQQVLSLREQQLGVQLEQLELTREQQRLLEQIQEQENALNRRREESRREYERLKAELDEALTAEQRQVQVLDEQMKLRKAGADLAAVEAVRARDAAERTLRVAQLQDRANSGGGIRDIMEARIEAAVAGEAGMVSVADATRRLYDARERQMEQEHALARQQQELQHQREQSEMRIAQLRLRAQRLDLETSLERERIGLEQAQVGQQRDNLAQQVLPGSGAVPQMGAPGDPAGLANVLPGTRGGPNWNDSFGWSAWRGRNHNGQDLGLDVGDPIHSIASGVVEQLIPKFGQVGGAVVIKNDDGTMDLYGHVDPEVAIGSRVRAGQKIATVTPDVRSDGSNNTHLHHEFWDAAGQRVDSAPRLRASLAAGTAPAAPAAPAPTTPQAAAAGPNGWSQLDLANSGAIDQYLDLPVGTTAAQQMAAKSGATYDEEDLRGIAIAVVRAMRDQVDGQGIPDTASEQAVRAGEQNIRLLERRVELLDEEDQFYRQIEANAADRFRLERETLAGSQANARSNLTADRTRDQVFAQIMGSADARLAADLSDAFGGFFSNAVRTGLISARQQGELDVQAFFEGVMGSMADRVLDSLITYALAPIDKVLKEGIFGAITGLDVEKVAAEMQAQAAEAQSRSVDSFGLAVDRFGASVDRRTGADLPGASPEAAAGNGGGDYAPPEGGTRLEVVPYGSNQPQGTAPSSNGLWGASRAAAGGVSGVQSGLDETASGIQELNTELPGLTDAAAEARASLEDGAKQTQTGFGDLQKNLGTVVGALAGIGMIAGGASMVGKGGTYNTLMGLAGIFGGIGGLAGAFSPRARGGDAKVGRTLLVGEHGPELFTPDANGQITAHEQTRAYLDAQSTLAARLLEDGVATPGGMIPVGRGRGRSGSDLFNASRDTLRSTTELSREREVERIGETMATRALAPIKLQYESSVVNQVEYVTAAQFRKGMADSVQQSRALTIKQLGSSNQTRRRLGIG